jgi:hypothetical protein
MLQIKAAASPPQYAEPGTARTLSGAQVIQVGAGFCSVRVG